MSLAGIDTACRIGLLRATDRPDLPRGAMPAWPTAPSSLTLLSVQAPDSGQKIPVGNGAKPAEPMSVGKRAGPAPNWHYGATGIANSYLNSRHSYSAFGAIARRGNAQRASRTVTAAVNMACWCQSAGQEVARNEGFVACAPPCSMPNTQSALSCLQRAAGSQRAAGTLSLA